MALVVVAQWRSKPGCENAVRDLLQRMAAMAQPEAGTLFYQAQVDAADSRAFLIFEMYSDGAAWEAHKSTAVFSELVVDHAAQLLETRSHRVYVPI